MPIQFPDMMPVPSAEEHRPFLNQLMKAMQFGIGFPRDVQKADLANKLSNLSVEEKEIAMPYIKQAILSQLEKEKYETEKNRLTNQFLNKFVLGEGSENIQNTSDNQGINFTGNGNTISQPSQKLSYGGTMSPNEQQQYFNQLAESTQGEASQVPGATLPINKQVPQQNIGQPRSPNGMNYAQASYGSKLLGLQAPHIENINGTLTAITPFGNIVVGQGLTKKEEQLQVEDAKLINDLEKSYLSSSETNDTLDALTDVITNPIFEKMRQSPIFAGLELKAIGATGSPDEKQLVGQYKALTGNIIKASARDFPGQFRIGEQTLMSSMKPTEKDNINIAKGKMESLIMLTRMKRDRQRLMAQLMRQGNYDPITAEAKADELVNGKQIRAQIKERLYHINRDSLKNLPPDQIKSIANEKLSYE
jgi:hypothetical protein